MQLTVTTSTANKRETLVRSAVYLSICNFFYRQSSPYLLCAHALLTKKIIQLINQIIKNRIISDMFDRFFVYLIKMSDRICKKLIKLIGNYLIGFFSQKNANCDFKKNKIWILSL